MNVRHQIRSIDLAILRDNVAAIRRAVPSSARLLAVVKADAYGHGMLPVARTALKAGADFLAVALVEEGAALREGGIDAPILVLGATSPDEADAGVQHDLTLTVCNEAMVASVQAAGKKLGKIGQVHLKIDSGMNRIGVRSEQEVMDMLDAIDRAENVRLTGAFTHFADADGQDMTFTKEQLTRFRALTSLLPDGLILHCANSAAIHRLPEAAMGMVRAGISMYGYPPVASLLNLRPFMTWRTEITFVKDIAPGDTVSYGRTFTADKPMRVATVSCGYGDGYHRAASGKAEVLIGGKRAKVLGRICMDQMMADVTDIPGVKVGDEVVLMGRQGPEVITAEDIARWAGTISYEILLAATGRVERAWLHDE